MTLTETKEALDEAGFWCSFSSRKRVLKVYLDGEYVARFDRAVDHSDIERLKKWSALRGDAA